MTGSWCSFEKTGAGPFANFCFDLNLVGMFRLLGQVLWKAKCDIDDGHVLLAKSDNDGVWMFDSIHSYHICNIKAYLQE